MTSKADTTKPYGLNKAQIEMLAKGISATRVKRDNKGRAHVQAWDVRRWLTRIFGYAGWSTRETSLVCVSQVYGEHPGDGHAIVTVVYRCSIVLTVRDLYGNVLGEYHGSASGDAQNFPAGNLGDAHDFALKTADSQAIKRAAMNLGDQFGLSLYNAGSLEPVINASVAYGPLTPTQPLADDVGVPEDEAAEAARQIALQDAAAEQTGRGEQTRQNVPTAPARQHRRAPAPQAQQQDDAPPMMTREQTELASTGSSVTIPRKGPDAGPRPAANTPNGRARGLVWDVDDVLRNLDDCGEALERIKEIRATCKRQGLATNVVRVPDRLLDEACIDKDGKPFAVTHYVHEIVDAAGGLVRRLCEASQLTNAQLEAAANSGHPEVEQGAWDELDRRVQQRGGQPRDMGNGREKSDRY